MNEIAILRNCRRCGEWRSIEKFYPLGKLCKECVRKPDFRTNGHSRIRSGNHRIAGPRRMVLTDKGRAQLAEWRAEEAPAVA